MNRDILLPELNEKASNHRRNHDLPFITNVAFIKLDQLEAFISEARDRHPEFDIVQINFIRYSLNADQLTILLAGRNLSQVSLMLIPGKLLGGNWNVRILADVNQNVFTLSIEEPGTNDAANTGLCPPRGNCQ
jgi:hypothetical protein